MTLEIIINNLNEDTLTHLGFSNVKWLGNIVDDMGFNYVGVKKGKLDYSLFYTLIMGNKTW